MGERKLMIMFVYAGVSGFNIFHGPETSQESRFIRASFLRSYCF